LYTVRDKVIFLLQEVQAGSGALPTSVGIGGPSPDTKRPVVDIDHPTPFGAEDKNEWSYTSIPPIYPPIVERDTFTFPLP